MCSNTSGRPLGASSFPRMSGGGGLGRRAGLADPPGKASEWPPACGAVPPYTTSAKRSARDEVAGVQDQLRAKRRFGQRFFQKRVALVGAAVDDENEINRHPEARPDGLVDPVASMSLMCSSSQERLNRAVNAQQQALCLLGPAAWLPQTVGRCRAYAGQHRTRA
jgi:hypothetical protein